MRRCLLSAFWTQRKKNFPFVSNAEQISMVFVSFIFVEFVFCGVMVVIDNEIVKIANMEIPFYAR